MSERNRPPSPRAIPPAPQRRAATPYVPDQLRAAVADIRRMDINRDGTLTGNEIFASLRHTHSQNEHAPLPAILRPLSSVCAGITFVSASAPESPASASHERPPADPDLSERFTTFFRNLRQRQPEAAEGLASLISEDMRLRAYTAGDAQQGAREVRTAITSGAADRELSRLPSRVRDLDLRTFCADIGNPSEVGSSENISPMPNAGANNTPLLGAPVSGRRRT